MTTTLQYDYKWNDDKVAKLEIRDAINGQTVDIALGEDDRYIYTSRLIGDVDFVVADRTFSIEEALYYAHVNLGILPPVNLPKEESGDGRCGEGELQTMEVKVDPSEVQRFPLA